MKADLEVILKFMEKLPKSVGIYAENYYQYYLAVTTERPLIGGLGLNIYNRESVELLGLNSFVVSSELTKSEINDIGLSCSVFTFGYLPVMYFCHCPIKHFTGCNCNNCKYSDYSLSDKYGEYKVRRIKVVNCYFEMLNNSCHAIAKNQLDKDMFACIDISALENSVQYANNYLNNPCFIFDNSIKLTKGQFLRGIK